MADKKRATSERMRRVGMKDTAPEMKVRRLLHSLGYRYRLHAKDLPGSPDVVFRGRRKAIFVHGCFWHRHEGCKRASMPSTRQEYWQDKFNKNVARDARNESALAGLGWQVLTVWECEVKDAESLKDKLVRFLGP